MMGRLNHDQGEFFYSFLLDEAVPDDLPVRTIAAVLDSWVQQSAVASAHKVAKSIHPRPKICQF
jgi:hypothetical protein